MFCRSCNQTDLFCGLDMGMMPIAGELSNSISNEIEYFETKMMVCKNCGLGQMSKDIEKERLFQYYRFKTSESESFLKHAEKYANESIEKYDIKNDDWVLEIASNDGYLLKIFKEKGINALGIDPAKNIAMYSICDDLPTIVDFFGSSLAKEILRIKGYPKLIVANNVLAHVPDINDFMEGISILCNDETLVSIENPSIMNILINDQFDSIYHEHYSYLSCNSVAKLANKFNLELFNIENIPVHGNSTRFWLSKIQKRKNIVNVTIDKEIKDGLFDENKWKSFSIELNNKINNFHNKVKSLYDNGKIICGYAASGKATQLLHFAKINKDWIKYVADDVCEKQNKFIPGLNIPIVSKEIMLKEKPDEIIIFSWNIYEEIKNKIGKTTANIWRW